MRLFGFQTDTPRTPSADSLAVVYKDGLLLIARIYAGESWSRRAMARRMSQPRWTAAYRLLQSVDVLDRQGRLWWEMAPDAQTAEILLREAVNRRRQREGHRSYVSPRGPRGV